MVQFQKFDDFRNCETWGIFGIFRMGNVWNFVIANFLILLFKLEDLEFFQFGKPKFGSKNWLFWNCLSIRYSALLAILPILISI